MTGTTQRVIVAEDDEALAQILQLTLEHAGYTVEVFSNGREVWERLLRQHEPAVVLLDWMIPDMPGIEVCRSIRSLGMHDQIHMVILSGLDDPHRVVEALEVGADDYLRKPIAMDELLSRMRVAWRKLEKLAALERRVHEMTHAVHGRYEMKGLIGKGGLGEVFEGWDSLLGRAVAVKRFRPSARPGSKAQEEMTREARIMASLNHPNLVTIYDCWDSPMGMFVVMELLRGTDLDKLIDGNPVGMSFFLKLCEELLSGLGAAHEAGILHCDLKPSNVMVLSSDAEDVQDMSVKILDFGVARLVVEAQQTHTSESAFVEGSVYFIAPEILVQESTDQRSDLYSLGHMLFFVLTGKHAISQVSVMGVMEAHLKGGDYDLLGIRPDVPAWLAHWILKFMHRQPKDRHASAQVALQELRQMRAEAEM